MMLLQQLVRYLALNDFVLAPIEEGIDFSETSVEATSWGQLKSSLGR